MSEIILQILKVTYKCLEVLYGYLKVSENTLQVSEISFIRQTHLKYV